MSKITFRVLFFTEDARQDEAAIKRAFAVDGLILQLICVDNETEMVDELNSKVFDFVLIGDPLINTNILQVLDILTHRQQKIPHMILVGSLDDFSAVAILEKTGTLQHVTKTTMGTLLLMVHKELEQADERFDDNQKAKRGMTDMMGVVGALVELRDKGTQGHTERVALLTVKLARKMNIPKADIILIRQGALIHDCGKVGTPDAILLKQDKLTDEEWVEMKKHPQVAYDMLKNIEALRDSLDIPYCHHERWDGKGYPRGLSGKSIPLAARIFSIVDVYDALTSERPYRDALSKDATLAHIESLSGIAFDPAITSVFLEMMRTQ